VIPYFEQPVLRLGPIAVHAFGVLVACGVLLGARVLHRRAAADGLSAPLVTRFINWILMGGFLGAHLFDRLVYFPKETLADPVSIVRFWEGLSSFGGFVGGTVRGLLFFWRRAERKTAWKYMDAFVYAFPVGWIFGRLGCFVAYDHPGRPTRSLIGQMYKDGVVRHNLGLEEAIYTMGIAVLFYVLGRRPRPAGFFLGLFLLLYAPLRFGLDFLRIVDVRYFGLTPGQYGCVALFGIGITVTARTIGNRTR
jgi:phosphatidylglycerol---prolipoprotein diacylglyceryl transferase